MDFARIHRRAERHHGLITRAELHRCGVSDRQIAGLVRAGYLIRLHRGVYRLPAAPESARQQALAGCLAIGNHAFASHLTAACVWGIVARSGKPEVTIPWD